MLPGYVINNVLGNYTKERMIEALERKISYSNFWTLTN